jgi:hypothetical protein
MGVLVDWPGEQPAFPAFVFLASESQPPPCAEATLAPSRPSPQARGAQCAVRGHDARARDGWCCPRIEPHRDASGVELVAAGIGAAEPRRCWRPRKPAAAGARGGRRRVFRCQICLKSACQTGCPPLSKQEASRRMDEPSDASRLGEAMHRLLEHAGDTDRGAGAPSLRRPGRVRRLSAPAPSRSQRAGALARRILLRRGGLGLGRRRGPGLPGQRNRAGRGGPAACASTAWCAAAPRRPSRNAGGCWTTSPPSEPAARASRCRRPDGPPTGDAVAAPLARRCAGARRLPDGRTDAHDPRAMSAAPGRPKPARTEAEGEGIPMNDPDALLPCDRWP